MLINGYEIKLGADLRGADLRFVDLCGANLRRANLCEADLREADLRGADLRGADLCEADLRGADLRGADLCGADLRGADLCGADLRGADLRKANLRNTCLDSGNKANQDCAGFTKVGKKHVYGYRTRKAGHIDQYRDGWMYSADWFSTANTECHPGLYIWPTIKLAKNWSDHQEIIQVKIPVEHIHKAGSKWRCRWFTVIGGVK